MLQLKKKYISTKFEFGQAYVPANVDIHMLDRHLLVCIHFAPTYQLPNQLPDEYTFALLFRLFC